MTASLRCPRGVVSLEALMALGPVLLCFLGITQLALLGVAQLVVQHAAGRSVRAAVVVLDDDPKFYGGAPRGDLSAAPEGAQKEHSKLDDVAQLIVPSLERFELSDLRPSGSPAPRAKLTNRPQALPMERSVDWKAHRERSRAQTGLSAAAAPQGARMRAIRTAAYAPLAALAPPLDFAGLDLRKSSPFASTVTGSLFERLATGLRFYGKAAAEITLHSAPDSPTVLRAVGTHAPITAHVSVLIPCRVPLAAALLCQHASSFRGQSAAERPDWRKLLLMRGRFRRVTAFASAQNHGANYHEGSGQ